MKSIIPFSKVKQLMTQLAEKVNQTDFNTVISSIGNGSPKGTYATLSALQTAFPAGTTGIYIVTADGGWYYWNGSVWTKGGTYQSTGIASGSITPDKISFMTIGKNMFNPATTTPSMGIDYNSGNLAGFTDHIASDYIAVSPNTHYVVNELYNLAFYDIAKVFISANIVSGTQPAGTSFLTPSNCGYIRMSVKSYITNPNIANETQLEQGTFPTTFEAYHYAFTIDNLPIITTSKIQDKAITVEKSNYFVVGKNLYDKAKSIDNYLINGNSQGEIASYAGQTSSNWMPAIPNSSYIWNIQSNYAFYDSNKVFISGVNNFPAFNAVVSPANTAYIRVSFSMDSKDTYQIEQNTASTSYLPYGFVLDPQYINFPTNNSDNWYKGKKLTTFGDSITEGNKWQPYLMSVFGFASHANLGVGGTKVSDDGGNNGFCTDTRVNTIPIDSDVIIIMGGTNDWNDRELGDLTYPYDTSKFKGGLATTIQKVKTRCPNALVVVMSLLSGRGTETGVNMTAPVANGLGLVSEDYAKATEEVCHFMSTEFIDVFGKTGINQFNRATYIQDVVHPNTEGGKAIARVVVNGLKNVEPLS